METITFFRGGNYVTYDINPIKRNLINKRDATEDEIFAHIQNAQALREKRDQIDREMAAQ